MAMKRFVQTSCFPISLFAALCFIIGLNPVQAQYTNLHEFTAVAGDGGDPAGDLILSGTTFYGMTSGGGAFGQGVVFRMNADGSGYTNLHEFAGGSDGGDPNGSLTLTNDMLYGMTTREGTQGAGMVFRMNVDGSGYTNLHEFAFSISDGAYPFGSMTLSDNMLYGATYTGGASFDGVVFRMNVDGSGYTNLHEFAGGSGDGTHPYYGSLTLSSNTFYDMTPAGGASGAGVVFRMNVDGSGYTNLHEFAGGSGDGNGPYGSLTFSNNMLYGMTYGGGSNDTGVIFAYMLNNTTPTAPLTVGGAMDVVGFL